MRVGEEFHRKWRRESVVQDIEGQLKNLQSYREILNEDAEFWIWQNLEDGELETDKYEVSSIEALLEQVSAQLAAVLEDHKTAEVMENPMPYAKLAIDSIAMAYLAEDTEGEEYRNSLEKAAR